MANWIVDVSAESCVMPRRGAHYGTATLLNVTISLTSLQTTRRVKRGYVAIESCLTVGGGTNFNHSMYSYLGHLRSHLKIQPDCKPPS